MQQTLTLDSTVRGLRRSATLESLRLVADRRRQDLPVFNWGLGANALPAPEQLIFALQNAAGQKHYTSVHGIPELARLIAERYSTELCPIEANGVIVAPGLKQLLHDVQKCWGGEIIHIAPYWVSYAEQTRLMGKQAQVISTRFEEGCKLKAHHIHAHCQESPERPRLIIFNHPTNPTGQIYTRSELEALAKAFSRYQIVVFADEIYLGSQYQGPTHSIAEFYPHVIRGTGLSKEFASGGDRIGWVTLPRTLNELRDAMMALGTSTYSCAPVPQQHAAVIALKGGPELEHYGRRARAIYHGIGLEMASRLNRIGIACFEPQAAWYLWLNFEPLREDLAARGVETSTQLCQLILEETGNVFIAGSEFGESEEKLFLRASFIDFNGSEAMEDLLSQDSSPDLVSKWCRHMTAGVDALGRWLA